MNLKMIGIIIIGVMFLAYSFGLFYLGEQHCKAAVNTAVIKAEQKQDKAVEKVQVQQAKREVQFQKRTEEINAAKTNCDAVDLPTSDSRLLSVRPNAP